MKRSADELDAEKPVQDDKKKYVATKLQCPPIICEDNCPHKGSHNNLIISLVNLQDTRLEEWKKYINEVKESRDLNQPLEDPNPKLRYPLLHWAAMLGKVKAVTWLLQQEFIGFFINQADLVCSLSNVSNEKVLFSMVRFLHEGVETRSTGDIMDKYFIRILDVFLKHDPNVLLVQESHNKDTVLHQCARREEDSNAPFFKYLKRILGKLEEYSKKKDSRLPLNKILEARNREGDAFLHLLARRKDKRKEAREIINIAEDKFSTHCLGKMRNNDGKTAQEIWNEFKPDPEVFQTSSQEIHDVPFLTEASCNDDERPSKNLGHQKQEIASHSTAGSSGDQGYPGGSEEDIGIERLRQGLSASNRDTGLHPEVQSDGGRGDKGDEPHEVIPTRLFEGIEGQQVLQTEEPDEGQESDLHPGRNTDTRSGTLNVVQKLIHDTKLKEVKLEQEKKILKEYEDKVKEQKALVQALEEEVQSNKNELHDCKNALSILK